MNSPTDKFTKYLSINEYIYRYTFQCSGIDHEGAFATRSLEQINSIVRVNIEAKQN